MNNATEEKPYIPWTLDKLETLVRDIITQGVEGPKVDRKQILAIGSAAEQVEFAKDVSAIANTDDDAYQDHGFIIFGVNKSGELCGGITAFERSAIDNTRAALIDAIKKYIAPVPKLFAFGFLDPQAGPWGVIVIPPSNRQAHLFIKEFSPRPTPGDWFVRVGEVTVKARPEDYARVFDNATRRAMAPLQEELRELRLELRTLKSSMTTSHPQTFILPGVDNATTAATRFPATVPELVERELSSVASRIETEMVKESLRLATLLHKSDSLIPWTLHSPSMNSPQAVLSSVELATKDLARTYGTIARLDSSNLHTKAASRGLVPLSEQTYPPAGTGFNQALINLRLYPVALLLLSTMMVAVSTQNAVLPRALLDNQLVLGLNRERIEPIIAVYAEMLGASLVFERAQDQEYRYPVAHRMREVIPPWLEDLVLGPRPIDCFYIAEFLTYLAILDAGALPVPGNFMIYGEARLCVGLFLRSRPEWIRGLYRNPLEKLLTRFDESMKARSGLHDFMDRGFKENAVAAWEAGMDQSKWVQLTRTQH
ncbi:AlbA family DNA-binding domain-containing protein [Sorangium sp. So ce854]|uniref:AlbA family DNA-binding domain-containing protein n=1 Tax=Sorangium sp. So ce854 TaxID=3133322 RepID=UPI003F5E872B